MKFKEQFPSLTSYEEVGDDLYYMSPKDMMEHCLDKQRVKDAIETVRSMIVVSAVNHNYVLELIQKELGL